MHQIAGLRQRFECLENQHRARPERLAIRQQGSLASGQMRCTEGFKVRRLIGQNEVDTRSAFADEFDQEAVLRHTSDQHHLAVRNLRLGQKLRDLVRHHLAQGQDNVPLGRFPLVQAMRAVRLHEHGTTGRDAMSAGAGAGVIDILYPQVHAAELLAEEFAGPRCALVAGVGVNHAAAIIEDVDHQVLAAHGHDSAGLEVHGIEAAFDGYRSDDLGQLYAATTFISRDYSPQRSDGSEKIHEPGQRPGDISLVGEDRVLDAVVLRDEAELQGGGSDIDSKRLFSHGEMYTGGLCDVQ
jgi:hypothetical protein